MAIRQQSWMVRLFGQPPPCAALRIFLFLLLFLAEVWLVASVRSTRNVALHVAWIKLYDLRRFFREAVMSRYACIWAHELLASFVFVDDDVACRMCPAARVALSSDYARLGAHGPVGLPKQQIGVDVLGVPCTWVVGHIVVGLGVGGTAGAAQAPRMPGYQRMQHVKWICSHSCTYSPYLL